jgi:hypothetical protein
MVFPVDLIIEKELTQKCLIKLTFNLSHEESLVWKIIIKQKSNKMKIGIVTFHSSNNFGAVLQAIALVEFFNAKGHDARIIDYRPEYKTEKYNPFKISFKHKSLKHFFYSLYSIPSKYKDEKEFAVFRKKYMKIWEPVYLTSDQIISYPPNLDLMIAGSDQVWNPELLGAVDKVYYLGFGDAHVRRASYAPSFGRSDIDRKYWGDLSRFFKKLDFVSVRELDGKRIIEDIAGIKAEHVLDPVFLLSKEQWDSYADQSISIGQRYVLLYARERSPLLSEVACKVAKERKMKIVNISKIMLGLGKYDKNITSIGPGEFLSLVKNASAVCTNSFHGTAFSIVYEKPFFAVPHRTRNSRIDSILNMLDLSSQIVSEKAQLSQRIFSIMIEYDTKKAVCLLENERRKSIDFLEKVLYEG